MSDFSVDDLTTPLTSAEIKASIYDVLGIVGVDTTSWKSGAPLRVMIAAVSIILASFSVLISLIARSSFLELASGSWLTLVARYVYGVRRFDATFATGSVTLTNSGGGVYGPFAPGDVIFSNSTTGKTYRNTGAFTLNALATTTEAIEAIEAGSASTSTPGAIDTLETTMLLVTVANGLAVVGQDAELDTALRLRCTELLGARSPNGPEDAYASAARSSVRAADGSSIGVNRVRISRDGLGNVFVYCATASGAVPGDATDPATDLGKVNDDIQRSVTPLAVTAHTASANPVVVPISYTAYVLDSLVGFTVADLQALVATALANYFVSVPIGGYRIGAVGAVYREALQTVIRVKPEVFHVDLTLPAADVALFANDVPVLGAVTGSVQFVQQRFV